MPTMNFAVITAEQRTALMAMNNPNVAIDPKAIDNAAPGVGININPDATGISAGAVVTLGGKYVAPKRIVDDPEYLTYAADMVAAILDLPWCVLDTDTIYAPVLLD